ncbi:MAG: Fe3+-siderophores ABC transporter protein [bacterium]|nr:Fe3+-siderophores ABC transporter protein [bacterium]
MRVISLVPSLTESLLECGVDVVGRTRFCVHPADRVAGIPVVGGTKEVDWAACQALRPDLVVLDREENTREMADSCPWPWTAVHITAVENVGTELSGLARRVGSDALLQLAGDWSRVADRGALAFPGWRQIPGAETYLSASTEAISRLEYVIWRKPWRVIGPGTFIHSMLRKVGLGDYLPSHESRYPEMLEAAMNRSDTFYLYSSEPYPFADKEELLGSSGIAGAIVDGELYSWYGVRSYRFLEALSEG